MAYSPEDEALLRQYYSEGAERISPSAVDKLRQDLPSAEDVTVLTGLDLAVAGIRANNPPAVYELTPEEQEEFEISLAEYTRYVDEYLRDNPDDTYYDPDGDW